MKKKYTHIVILMLLSGYLSAQHNIDEIKYRCTYKATTLKDTLDANYFTEDIMALDIGDHNSVFYSLRKSQRDSLIAVSTASGQLNRSKLSEIPKGINKYKIYVNYSGNKITFLNMFAGRNSYYFYEEQLEFPEWHISTEKAEILGYNCQLATCTYKGREYKAWFTTEIPLAYGPYKFGGLPGLILKIEDTKKHYIFEAIGFEKIDIPFEYSTENYKKITKKEYQKIERDYLKDPIAWINMNSGITIQGLDSPQQRAKEGLREEPHLPIELKE